MGLISEPMIEKLKLGWKEPSGMPNSERLKHLVLVGG